MGTNPSDIIELGNNWEILVALKVSKSLQDLNKMGIRYTQKQIDVLQTLNFIEKQSEKYKTIITILNAEETNDLRKTTKEIAKKIVSLINNDYLLFSKYLKDKGFENNTYTLFFSYIMDNIVWRKFEAEHILPENDITVEKPLWDGTIWFKYPERQFACGTNSKNFEKTIVASTNWSDISELSKKDIVDFDIVLKDLKTNHRITDTIIKKSLCQYEICDEKGNLKVPFFKKDNTDNFNIYCNDIATKIFKYLVKEVDFTTINKKYNIKSKGDAIIIIYHDIMYDILDILEENGLIKKPNAFSHPDKTKLTDLKDIFFIYEK